MAAEQRRDPAGPHAPLALAVVSPCAVRAGVAAGGAACGLCDAPQPAADSASAVMTTRAPSRARLQDARASSCTAPRASRPPTTTIWPPSVAAPVSEERNGQPSGTRNPAGRFDGDDRVARGVQSVAAAAHDVQSAAEGRGRGMS